MDFFASAWVFRHSEHLVEKRLRARAIVPAVEATPFFEQLSAHRHPRNFRHKLATEPKAE
jgi:hypothetical protein